MIMHHLIVLMCIAPVFIVNLRNLVNIPSNYNTIVAYNYLAEASTIPLNMAWILYTKNKKNTVQFKLYYIATILLYIPFRLYSYTKTSLMVLWLHTPLKYLQFFMTGLNYYWFFKMCKKVFHKEWIFITLIIIFNIFTNKIWGE